MKRRAEHKEPFVRMAKRASIAPATAWMIRGAALLGALLMGALLLLILGHEPLRIYREMARGAFGGAMYLKETARTAVPEHRCGRADPCGRDRGFRGSHLL